MESAWRGPFLPGVATTEEVSQRAAGGVLGPRARGDRKLKTQIHHGEFLSSLTAGQQGQCESAPTWPEVAPELQPPGTAQERPHLWSKQVKMLTPEREGTPGPAAGILFCEGHLSRYKERCPVWTQLEATGSRILTGAFHMETPWLRHPFLYTSQTTARAPLNL